MAWFSRGFHVCRHPRNEKGRHLQSSPHLSWVRYWGVCRLVHQIPISLQWVWNTLFRFFSSISYKAGLIHCIKNIKNTVLLSQGKISLTEYRDLTTFRFSDFIYSKNNVLPCSFRSNPSQTWVSACSTRASFSTKSILSTTKVNNPKSVYAANNCGSPYKTKNRNKNKANTAQSKK